MEDIEQVFRSFDKIQEKISANNPPPDTRQLKKPAESFEQAISNMYLMFAKDFLAFIKAFDCTLSEDHPENYMTEREWRRYQHFWFTPEQVRRIIVAKGFGDRLVREFPEYASKISEWEGS